MSDTLLHGGFYPPKEVMQRIDRTDDDQRLMAYAMEHLVFSHPYKKFSVRVKLFEGIPENPNPSGRRVSNLQIFDYNAEVCMLSFFKPQGENRNATQLNFHYNYDVHVKDPKDTKRTSNAAKIKECVLMIKAAQAEHIFNGYGSRSLSRRFDVLIDKESNLSDSHRAINSFFRGFMYIDTLEKQVSLFDDLLTGRKTAQVEKCHKEFLTLRDKWQSALSVENKLRRANVVVVRNNNGDYRAVYKMKGTEAPDFYMVDYESKDQLSPEIFGKVALLEISESNDGNEHGVDGVGMVEKIFDKLSVYALIGEDIVDPRTQGKNEGS